MTFWDQGDILKPKNSKSVTFTLKGGFRTFWSRLAHSAPAEPTREDLLVAVNKGKNENKK